MVILDDAAHFLQLHGLHGLHRTSTDLDRAILPLLSNQTLYSKFLEANNHRSLPTPKLLVWSAPDQPGIQRLLAAYRPFLVQHPDCTESLAHALATRRSRFPWRSFALMDPQNRLPIQEFRPSKPVKATGAVRIAFAFTGQGAQYSGMGNQLMAFGAFMESIKLSEKQLEALGCPWSLQDALSGRHEFDIDSPEYSQTLTTCLQIALVDLLQSFQIVPSVVLGHSSGEVAASYACGALSRASAITVSHHRGILSARLAETLKGLDLAMMAVGLSRNGIQFYFNLLAQEYGTLADVQLSCVNSSQSVTLSGPWSQLSKIEFWLRNDNIFVRRLHVPIAYHHSKYMSMLSDEYIAAISRTLEPGKQREQTVPLVSSVTGDVADHALLASGQYWDQNLTSTVEFERAMSKLGRQAHRMPRQRLGKRPDADLRATHILEIGPHSVLQGPIQDCIKNIGLPSELPSLTYLPSLVRKQSPTHTVLNAVGSLWCAGLSTIHALRVNNLAGVPHQLPYDLPPYPFDHTRDYWLEGRLSRNLRLRDTPRHDLLGTRSLDWNPKLAQWRNIIRLAELPWLRDHKIGEQVVFPAAGMLVMAIEALKQLFIGTNLYQGMHITNAVFSHAIAIPDGKDQVEIQFNLSSPRPFQQETASQFRMFAIENGSYIECCAGTIRAMVESQDINQSLVINSPSVESSADIWLRQITETCQEPAEDLYSQQKATSIFYGPCFQNLENVRLGSAGGAAAELNTETWAASSVELQGQSYMIHPSTLDGLAQLLFPALNRVWEETTSTTMMPTRIHSLWIQDIPDIRHGKLSVASVVRPRGLRGATGDIVATTRDSKTPLIVIRGLETTILAKSDTGKTQEVLCEPRPLCHRIISKPHLLGLTEEQLLSYCVSNRPSQAEDAVIDFYWKAAVTITFVYEALEYLQNYPSPERNSHFLEYIKWMERQKRICQEGSSLINEKTVLDILANHADRKRLEHFIETSSAEGALLMTIGRRLVEIISGTVDALDLMFQSDLLNRYYHEMIANDHFSYPACRFIDLMSHQNPSMKILEVGAGTGAITSRILDALNSDGMLTSFTY